MNISDTNRMVVTLDTLLCHPPNQIPGTIIHSFLQFPFNRQKLKLYTVDIEEKLEGSSSRWKEALSKQFLVFP